MTFAWDDAVAYALTLPDAELASSYGKPAVKVRGKPILATGREPGSYVLMASLEEVEMLIATDPDTFWQTPHYQGWPALLVRAAAADPERMKALIDRAWSRRASAAQRRAYEAGGRA